MNSDLTQIPPQGNFATINGMQMYYEVYGEGTPLVLLHGFTGSSLVWQPYIGEFAKHFRVIVPDLRGHGRTLDPTNQFTLAQQALDVFVLLDQLEIEHFKAIGNSGGGCSLQYMAAQQPERLEAIILASCSAYFPEQTATALLAIVDEDDASFEPRRHHHLQDIRQIRTLVNQMPKIVEDYNTQPPDLSKITAQTLIVSSDRDGLSSPGPTSVSMPFEMYTSIANTHLWIVPNAGHAFVNTDPDRYAGAFIQTALEFLRGEWL
jgi:pimeloyl-ACP methyl ester carboxylesterase